MRKIVAIYVFVVTLISSQNTSNLWAVEAPKPRSRSEVEAVLSKALKPPVRRKLRELNVVLVAFKKKTTAQMSTIILYGKSVGQFCSEANSLGRRNR
jgi:hypothetical protein